MDFTRLYLDERGYCVTADQLAREFAELSEDEKNGRTVADYIIDCLSINGGTLKAISR